MSEWVFQVAGIFATGVGVYAGIRADLAAIREKAESAAHSAAEAHKRIDRFFFKGAHHGD
jgi:hypothetical protein